jgi:hypothetical protein
MKRRPSLSALLSCAVLTTGAAYGQQPPDVVQSDAEGNTAMGSSALSRLVTSNLASDNTASGPQALNSNTLGSSNTASGARCSYSGAKDPNAWREIVHDPSCLLEHRCGGL